MRALLSVVAAVAVSACGAAGGGGSGGGSASGGGAGATGGGTASYNSLDELLAVAPLSWPLAGTVQTTPSGRVSFLVPPSWTVVTFSNVVRLTAPAQASGQVCEIFVFDPVAAPGTELAQLQLLVNTATGLFPQGTVLYGEYGSSDQLRTRRRGSSGFGWRFVGAQLETRLAAQSLAPWLAIFGAEAVPVVTIATSGATCLSSTRGQVDAATVWHSLGLDTFPIAAATYRQSILGSWFAGDGAVGALRAYAANGHYVQVSTINGQYVDSGKLYDVTASFAGDGTYFLYGSVLARFPAAGRPYTSVLVRQYEEQNPSNTTGWECELKASTEGQPFESCLYKSN